MVTTVGEAAVTIRAIIERAVVEAPVVEAPVVEAPVIEATVVEAPVVVTPIIEATVVEATVVEATVVEALVVEAPVIETTDIDTPAEQEPDTEPDNETEPAPEQEPAQEPEQEPEQAPQPLTDDARAAIQKAEAIYAQVSRAVSQYLHGFDPVDRFGRKLAKCLEIYECNNPPAIRKAVSLPPVVFPDGISTAMTLPEIIAKMSLKMDSLQGIYADSSELFKHKGVKKDMAFPTVQQIQRIINGVVRELKQYTKDSEGKEVHDYFSEPRSKIEVAQNRLANRVDVIKGMSARIEKEFQSAHKAIIKAERIRRDWETKQFSKSTKCKYNQLLLQWVGALLCIMTRIRDASTV